jgi:hypothetical protein
MQQPQLGLGGLQPQVAEGRAEGGESSVGHGSVRRENIQIILAGALREERLMRKREIRRQQEIH